MAGFIQKIMATYRALYSKSGMDEALGAALHGDVVVRNLLTGTRVDTGWWLVRPALRLVLTRERLILYAPGKRPVLEARPVAGLQERSYNHFTGEWVLAATPELSSRRLRLSPDQVRQLVQTIHSTPTSL